MSQLDLNSAAVIVNDEEDSKMDYHYINDPTENDKEFRRCYNACLRHGLKAEDFRIYPSADDKYCCAHCDHTFPYPYKLASHHASVHNRSLCEHYCKTCDKYFATAWILGRHLRQGVHRSTQP